MTDTDGPLLVVSDLHVETTAGDPIVEDVSLELRTGELLGIVGESGSGKTTLALALLGYAKPGARIASGSIRIAGEELVGRSETDLRTMRGRLVSYVPQDPDASLNPAMRIGQHLREVLRTHTPDQDSLETIEEVLERVQLPRDRWFLRRYPHELSGGQQQRVMIAMSIVCQPALVVLDEPTTGLDVVTQARILEEVDRLLSAAGVGVVYVSHDLAVVAGIADRVAVMYAGQIVEEAPTATIINAPRHPYTRGLISSIPDHERPVHLRGIPGHAPAIGEDFVGCHFAARCPIEIPACHEAVPALVALDMDHRVRCIRSEHTQPLKLEPALQRPVEGVREPLLDVRELVATFVSRSGEVVAANRVSFHVSPGECVALVGESGSGKTTIARTVIGLHEPDAGQVLLDGEPLASLARKRRKEDRRRIQIVFQNPYASLNPRHTVGETVLRPMRFFRSITRRDAENELGVLFERVRLPARIAARYPRELSGGERQRVAVARALAAEPDLILCDEITSALDVSVQAVVLDLLSELREALGLAMLFISHDLGVVATISDRILVLEHGEVRESGTVQRILTEPDDPYTRTLLESAPRIPRQLDEDLGPDTSRGT